MDTKRPKTATAVLGRRTVLAAALTGAAGMASARLLSLRDATTGAPVDVKSAATGAGLDWVSPLDREPAKIAHLLRRATFGATPGELDNALSDGYPRAVDRLLESTPVEPSPFPGGDEATRGNPLKLVQLQQWWLDHILSTSTPFAETMTLFWHGHFTSDYRKVGLQEPFLYWQNLTWRRMALGDFRDMLMAVTTDPAMLRYLDLGQSTGTNPNENYSRELMELFTMGTGNYTEDDVRSGAKALAGWREPITPAMVKDLQAEAAKQGVNRKLPQPDEVHSGVYDARRAYNGTLTFLGKTGRLGTKDVLDAIIAQPATAPFVARKVARAFVAPDPDDAYVKRLGDVLRRTWSVKDLLRAVFTSPEFTDARNYRALVKGPAEYAVSAAKALATPAVTRVYLQQAQQLGQTLFDPPDVGGWPSNESWVSSNTMLARANFAALAVQQARRLPPLTDAVATQVEGVLSPQTADLLNSSKDDKTGWTILLASPEFQLK